MLLQQRKKIDVIVGIDPDVDKNGVAYLECDSKKLEVSELTFPLLLDYLRFVKRQSEVSGKNFRVVVEAGWLNKGNWHISPKDTKAVAAAKGNHTGRNHETGRKIVEMCKHWEMDVDEVKPLAKCWSGKDKKITHQELASFTGLMQHTQQEGRDAALLAWVYAGFSIKLSKK